jgi:hypothetical protein
LFIQETEYQNIQNAHQSDRVEVIKLPPTITSNGMYNMSATKAASSMFASSVHCFRFLKIILFFFSILAAKSGNNSQVPDLSGDWGGLNLSAKSTASTDSDADAPLNLSLKVEAKGKSSVSNLTSNSLQSLSSITAAVGQSGGNSEQRCKLKPWNREPRIC